MDSTLRKKCEMPTKTSKGLKISHTTYMSTRKTYSRAEGLKNDLTTGIKCNSRSGECYAFFWFSFHDFWLI